METKYSTQLGVVFSYKINPNDGKEYFLDLNHPTTKDKLIRWEMKLKDKDVHKINLDE
jgi:hypothetical protein